MSQSVALDTQPRDTSTKRAAYTYRKKAPTLARDVRDALLSDINRAFFSVDTSTFVNTLFCLRGEITSDDILQKLSNDGYYGNNRRWKSYPGKESKENEFYDMFVNAANAIMDHTPPEKDGVSMSWFDRHSQKLQSSYKDTAVIRPDCILASHTKEMAELDEEIRALDHVIHQLDENINKKFSESSSEKSVEESSSESSEKSAKESLAKLQVLKRDTTEKLVKKSVISWMHTHIVAELQDELSSNALYESVIHALVYMRQMLLEQLDRRFVIGLVLCHDELLVLLCDRSGILITHSTININKDPKTFIQIIGSLKQMGPHELGWNTTMRIYDPKDKKDFPSYAVGKQFDPVTSLENSRYHNHWVIQVAVGKGKAEKYVSIAVVSAARSRVIRGSGTLVFEVVRYDEKYLPETTYILKRYWRPAITTQPPDEKSSCNNEPSHPSEAFFYWILERASVSSDPSSLQKSSLKKMHGWGDVQVPESSDPDSTSTHIRRGLNPDQPVDNSFKKKIKDKSSVKNENFPDSELLLYCITVGPSDKCEHTIGPIPPSVKSLQQAHEPVDRIQTDILIPTGIQILHFCDLTELLYCLSDCIEDLEFANQQGIVHRDVSVGNLLIMHHDGQERTMGRLNDFDHAKITYDFQDVYHNESQMQSKQYIQTMMAFSANNFSDDVVNEATTLKGAVSLLDYLQDLVLVRQEHFGLNKAKKSFTLADLGWDIETKLKKWPNFPQHQAQKGERTGTVAFMSAEVMTNSYVHQPKVKFVQHTGHDVESCFWVLIYLCLTRSGPGVNAFRSDLDSNYDLQDKIRNYLGNSMLDTAYHKKQLLSIQAGKRMDLLEDLMSSFHPYFDPLKPLVRQWWSLILLAYCYSGHEFYYIHAHIKRAIMDAILSLPNEVVPDTMKERNRRSDRQKHMLEIFLDKPAKRQKT